MLRGFQQLVAPAGVERLRDRVLPAHLPVGRAAHPEPAAGQSLRRYAPPGLSGGPSKLSVNAGPGSGGMRLRSGPSDAEALATRLGRPWSGDNGSSALHDANVLLS